MPNREKVIKGLDVCLKNIDRPDCPNDCPYLSDCLKYENRVVFQPLMRDALALLNEQEKEIKALRLLVKWATDCDFDIDGMVHVAKRTLEDHGAFEEGR